MADKSPMLLAYLSRSEGWTPASKIAEHLGVSTRTVRSYVTAVKVAAAPLDVILSSPDGYRLNRDAHAEFASRDRSTERAGTPRERITFLVTRLTHAGVELDVHDLADGATRRGPVPTPGPADRDEAHRHHVQAELERPVEEQQRDVLPVQDLAVPS